MGRTDSLCTLAADLTGHGAETADPAQRGALRPSAGGGGGRRVRAKTDRGPARDER